MGSDDTGRNSIERPVEEGMSEISLRATCDRNAWRVVRQTYKRRLHVLAMNRPKMLLVRCGAPKPFFLPAHRATDLLEEICNDLLLAVAPPTLGDHPV